MNYLLEKIKQSNCGEIESKNDIVQYDRRELKRYLENNNTKN